MKNRFFKSLAAALLTITALAAGQQAAAQNPATIGSINYNPALGAYEIKDANDLNALATYVSDRNSSTGLIFKQTADISFSYTTKFDTSNPYENNYTPIGGFGSSFSGTYDGQGYTISGIRVCKTGTGNDDGSQGLFGFIHNAVVKNVNLADATIVGHQNVGGIVGYFSGSSTVEDCTVANNVIIKRSNSNSDNHGGIVGIVAFDSNNGIIRRCYSWADLGILSGATGICGGLVGCLEKGTVSQCAVFGDSSVAYSGSHGLNDFYGASIYSSTNKPTGGIVGKMKNGTVTDCVIDYVDIYSSNIIDAICGEKAGGTITRCYHSNTRLGATNMSNVYPISLGSGVNMVTPRGDGTVLGTTGITIYDTGACLSSIDMYTVGMDFLFNYTGEVPEGQVLAGFTVNGVSAATDNGDGTWTITMPNKVTEIKAFFCTPVAYIDTDGSAKTATNYTTIENNNDSNTTLGIAGKEGWYVVGADGVTLNQLTFRDSHTHLILCDGASLTVNGAPDSNSISVDGAITVYRQTNGTGSLTANYTGSGFYTGINTDGDITILGGNVTATGYHAIFSINGSISIHGGSVTATGREYGIYAMRGSIALGWTDAADRITASSYQIGYKKTLSIRDGQGVMDADGNIYKGDMSFDNAINELRGKTLQPITSLTIVDDADNLDRITQCNGLVGFDVTLSGRTLYKDGNWDTLCLPFDLDADAIAASPLAGADIRKFSSASLDGSTLTLNFTTVSTIEAGRPYIIKWDAAASNITDPTFTGVTVKNVHNSNFFIVDNQKEVAFYLTYKKLTYTEEKRTVLFLGRNNTLYYPKPDLTDPGNPEYPSIGSCRAYFVLYGLEAGEPSGGGGPDAVCAFVLNFGDGTNTISVTAHEAIYAGQTRYWATFYHPTYNYRLPAGAQAFTLKSDKTLYRVGDGSVIPADCAVVIMADAAGLTLTLTGNGATPESGNILQGTSSAGAIAGARVLSKVGDDFGFFTFTGTIPANKAYYVE